MADASNVRHDTIVVPETMSPAQVRALAERKAQAQVGDDDTVAFVHLRYLHPVLNRRFEIASGRDEWESILVEIQ